MKGFFNSQILQPKIPPGHILGGSHRVKIGCNACGLYKSCLTPKMKPTGDGRKSILIVGEAPGAEEDKRQTQFCGDSGRFLEKKLKQVGINMNVDCRKTNAVNCRPPRNATPTTLQIDSCRVFLFEEIEKFKPKLILLVGGSAVQSFLGGRIKWRDESFSINKWRGWTIPDQDYQCWVVPVFHPSFVKRNEDGGDYSSTIYLEQDLKRAADLIGAPFPILNYEIQTIDTRQNSGQKYVEKLIQAMLERADKETFPVAFDYETTGLKPHKEGHQIISVAICDNPDKATSFLWNSGLSNVWKAFLRHRNILKIASNMKFEDTWSRVILDTAPRGWYWDTMIAAHVEDNRSKITGLKFQTYVRLGKLDYSSHIEPFLAGKRDEGELGANAFNRILELDKNELMIYNGEDALFEYLIAGIQMNNWRIE